LACTISVLLGSVGLLAAFSLVPRDELPAYLMAIAGVAINVPLGSAQSAWLALQRGWMVGFWDLVQTIFLVTGLATAVHFTADVRVYVAIVYGALLSASSLNMTCLLLTHPELRPTAWLAPIEELKTVMSTGLRYFILSAFDALSYMLDSMIALQLLGAAAAAQMLIVQRICIAAMGLLMVVAQPLWPAFVDAAARGDRRWIFRALAGGSLLVTTAAIAGSSVLVFLGPMFLKFWLKTNIGIDQSLLYVMGFWIVSISLLRVQILLLNALRIMQFQIFVSAFATLIAVTLKVVLAPRYGIAGILMATAATFPIIAFPAIIWRLARWRRSQTT